MKEINMKKLLLLFVLVLMLVSCQDSKPISVSEYKVVEIDSCEYVYGFYRLAHKGNCKYCTERRKKEYTQVVDSLFMMQE